LYSPTISFRLARGWTRTIKLTELFLSTIFIVAAEMELVAEIAAQTW
jgi:hypothetical protein